MFNAVTHYIMDLRQKNKLLYARAAFGISLTDFGTPMPVAQAVDSLFPKAAPGNLDMITDADWLDNSPKALRMIGDDQERKEKQKEFRDRTKDINLVWVEAMVDSNYPLLEKVALFWHGHFATRFDNPYFDQKLLNIFRTQGLGNFRDLLGAVSKSPAMLQFLNNRQNRKEHANENFAREVMELFTLGRGHYTEDDVKAAARAFTGWNFDEYGNFIFKTKQHDDGIKTFLGKTGNLDGDDVLSIILEQKQTAVFITQKIYRFFVSDSKIDDRRVNELAEGFYQSGYDISGLLKKIFTSDWFYSDSIVGAKIKSPIELLVGYQRLLSLSFENEQTLINLQRVLGQYLFNPPNVAGWPGGKYWIDSSSLVIRMRLPEALLKSRDLDLSAKQTDPDAGTRQMAMAMDKQKPQQFKIGKVDVDWTPYLAYWRNYKAEELPAALAGFLLPKPLSQEQLNEVSNYADKDNNDDYIKSLTILMMMLPEYQLT